MIDFSPLSLDFTAKELDAIAVSGKPVNACYRDSTLHVGRGQQAHGYEFVLTATFGAGNSGVYWLKGLTPRTRALVHEGRIKRLTDAGFTHPEAVEFVRSNARYKWELAGRILAALREPELAFIGFQVARLEAARSKRVWLDGSEGQASIFTGLSVPRATEMAQALRDISVTIAERARAERRLLEEDKQTDRFRRMGFKV